MLLDCIMRLLIVLMGGWFVASAIRDFKRNEYFLCGLDVMFVIWDAVILFKSVLFGSLW